MLLTAAGHQVGGDMGRTVQRRCRAHIMLRSEMCACGLENFRCTTSATGILD
jgi:hypothetical protein